MNFKSSLIRSKLYKNRHFIGFFFVAFMLYIFVAFSFARNPIGLSELELHSLSLSGTFSFPSSFIDLPYHFLQSISVHFFGPGTFGVRLISIILGILTGGLVVASIKKLVHSNVAIISGLIVSSSVFFLNYARLGAPMIMSMFLLALAIFAISQYVTNKKHRTIWLIITIFATIIGAYSPLGIYLLLALILIGIFHPSARAQIKKLKIWQWLITVVIGTSLLLPLIFAIINQTSILLELLGINSLVYSPTDIWHNIQALIMPWSIDSFGLVTPFFNIVEIALIILGIVTLARQFFSARSQLFLGLGLLAFIISILDITNSYILFIPYVFLMSFGIQTIIRKWYSIFPFNPYAKMVGLIPIGVLTFSLILTNFAWYNTSNFYDKNVIYNRNETYQIVREELKQLRAHSVSLVVDSSNIDLYSTLSSEFGNLVVGSSVDKDSDVQIYTQDTFDKISKTPSQVITNGNSQDYVTLKIYQKSN